MQLLKLNLSSGKQEIEAIALDVPVTEYNALCATQSSEGDDGFLVVCGTGFETGDPAQITVNAVAFKGRFVVSSLSPWP